MNRLLQSGVQRRTEAFSLTPALSRWEREKRGSSLSDTRRFGSANAQPKFFPLLAGEGQGEGERNDFVQIFDY